MNAITESPSVSDLVTIEQLEAMPQDGIERDLIRGVLREQGMTRRNRRHAGTELRIGQALQNWLNSQAELSAEALSGEVGCVLQREPDSSVGIDVAVFATEVLESQTNESTMVVGIPLLAVEILSPHDKQEDIHQKIVEYLRVGVRLIWVVDPDFKTVRVYRNGAEPVMFNRTQQITGEDVLPGFEILVDQFFPAWK